MTYIIIYNSREPHKLLIVWSRRSRRVTSTPMAWEPTLHNPYKGLVVWPVPDNHQVAVTLFKDPRTNELEDKDWSFILEDVSILVLLLNFDRFLIGYSKIQD